MLSGALALIALETVLRTGRAGQLGGIFAGIASGVRRFLDPTEPAIPERNAQPAAAAASTNRVLA